MWSGSAKGVFSVKSAYHLEHSRVKAGKGEYSMMAEAEQVWESIWKLNVQGVVKHFLWKACHDLLPTRLNLFKKRVIECNKCPVCENEVETTIHAVWCCPAASDVWAESDSPVQKWAVTELEFIELWKKLNSSLDEDEIELVACTLRGIWLRRNLLIFDRKFESLKRILSAAKQGRDEFIAAKLQNFKSKPDRGEVKWQRPTNVLSKINWDASISVQEKKVGIGMIARNADGDILACLSSGIQASMKPVLAEALALRSVMFFCQEVGISSACFEGDSQTIVNDANGKEEVWAEHGVVIEDIRKMLGDKPQWSVQFTYRKANNTAHILAKLGLNCNEENV
ncbi:uncharacterized protein LOC122290886 [Carya illinoinensis]|uniref:uncharacterized protein LOC122290886 n=1 Tax=Carya illinoinensis TaxID=32201 RepID=UPI001C728FF5|nr:uncharacterized protein LOC122290886 [Carya illinoinensis]